MTEPKSTHDPRLVAALHRAACAAVDARVVYYAAPNDPTAGGVDGMLFADDATRVLAYAVARDRTSIDSEGPAAREAARLMREALAAPLVDPVEAARERAKAALLAAEHPVLAGWLDVPTPYDETLSAIDDVASVASSIESDDTASALRLTAALHALALLLVELTRPTESP